MRNDKLIKAVSLLSVFMVLTMMVMPLAASAQFRLPGDEANSPNPLPGTTNKVTDLIIKIIQILLAVAGLIAVIFLIIGGFRYITAGGNEESSEAAKKTITNAIIGIVIIILAFVIVRVIANALVSTGSTGV